MVRADRHRRVGARADVDDDDLKKIPIIVITAKEPALDGIEDLRALRIVGFLHKPFEIATLLEKLGTALAVPSG